MYGNMATRCLSDVHRGSSLSRRDCVVHSILIGCLSLSNSHCSGAVHHAPPWVPPVPPDASPCLRRAAGPAPCWPRRPQDSKCYRTYARGGTGCSPQPAALSGLSPRGRADGTMRTAERAALRGLCPASGMAWCRQEPVWAGPARPWDLVTTVGGRWYTFGHDATRA
jgi:hypothetical protein